MDNISDSSVARKALNNSLLYIVNMDKKTIKEVNEILDYVETQLKKTEHSELIRMIKFIPGVSQYLTEELLPTEKEYNLMKEGQLSMIATIRGLVQPDKLEGPLKDLADKCKPEIKPKPRKTKAKPEKTLESKDKVKPAKRGGRPKIITPEIGKYIEDHPTIHSRKMAVMVWNKFDVKVSFNTISNYRDKHSFEKPESAKKKIPTGTVKEIFQDAMKEPANDGDYDMNKLCDFLENKLSEIDEGDRAFTPEDLERAVKPKNITDLWSQLASNSSPLRKKLNKKMGKKMRIFEENPEGIPIFTVGT